MRLRLALMVVAMGLFSACVLPFDRQTVGRGQAAIAKTESEQLLLAFALIRTLPKEEVAKEYVAATRSLAEAPTAANRVKVAWLLGLSGTSFQDLNRAMGLLQETIKKEASGEPGIKGLASLLHAQFSRESQHAEMIQALGQRLKEEQKRFESSSAKQLEEQIQSLVLKLKEEQKRAEALLTKQEENAQTINSLTLKLKEEQRRAELMQHKLDALTDIEKTLVERQQPKREVKQ